MDQIASRTVRERFVALVAAGAVAASMAIPSAAFADNAASPGEQTGSGTTELNMILEDPAERGGTDQPPVVPTEPGQGTVDEDGNPQENGDYDPNPFYNPDDDKDGLGDNLQFTVPSVINYVVAANGELKGPGGVYIENLSVVPVHVSSMQASAVNGWTFVDDAAQSDASNSVELRIGPAADQLNAASYLDKTSVRDADKWNMTAAVADNSAAQTDRLTLVSGGNVAHIDKDVTSASKFGELQWYLTPGVAE